MILYRCLPFFLKILDLLGINALFRYINRNKAVILWYHGICDDNSHEKGNYSQMHLRESIFKTHLECLRKWGYSFVSLTELANRLKNGMEIRKLAVLTFDDGYQNVITKAYPTMQTLGAKGCLYLVSNLIGTRQTIWTYKVQMAVYGASGDTLTFSFKGKCKVFKLNDWRAKSKAIKTIVENLRTLSYQDRIEHLQQLKDPESAVSSLMLIASPGQIKYLNPTILECGSHTRYHSDCAQIPLSELTNDLLDSKKVIGELAGCDVRHFCYPYGSYNKSVVSEVKRVGYESATTIIPGFVDAHSDPLQLKRIGGVEDLATFKALASGTIVFPLRLYSNLKNRILNRK